MKNIILLVLVILISHVTLGQEKDKNQYIATSQTIQATLYHDNGMVAQKGFYTTDNKLDGNWISYDNKGNTTAIATYHKGIKVGSWMFYQGDTIKNVFFKNSDIIEVKTWTITDTRVVSNKP